MNEQDYLNRRDEIRGQLQERSDGLDNIVSDYIDIMSQLIVSWSRDTIERMVMEKAEITKSLPEDELRSMKNEMNDLLAELPEMVEEELNADEMWPHRMEIPGHLHKDRMEIQLAIEKRRALADEAVRRLLGQTGLLLRGRGYIDEDRRMWDFGLDGMATYRYPIPGDKSAEALMSRYFDWLRGYGELANELRSLEHSKQAEEAKRRWDSV